MTDAEAELLAEKLAEKLADKIQKSVTDGIYRDAGKNLIGMFKHVFWAAVIAIASWGFARYGNGGH